MCKASGRKAGYASKKPRERSELLERMDDGNQGTGASALEKQTKLTQCIYVCNRAANASKFMLPLKVHTKEARRLTIHYSPS